MTPGSNLLKKAMSLIAAQQFSYYAFKGRVTNDAGLLVADYAAAVAVRGSVQPVPRTMYESQGLDFQKSYFNFFVPQNVVDIQRSVSGDHMEFQGQRYQCLSNTAWYGIDGWSQVLCVAIPRDNC